MLLDQPIDLAYTVGRDAEQVVRKPAHLGARGPMLGPECAPDVIGILLSHIRLEKHLQRDLPGFASCTHESALSCQPSAFRPLQVYCRRNLFGLLLRGIAPPRIPAALDWSVRFFLADS